MFNIFQNYRPLLLQILLFAINENGSIRMTRSLVSTWAAWAHQSFLISLYNHAARHHSRIIVILNKTEGFRFVKNLQK